jgi:hypothetical protein
VTQRVKGIAWLGDGGKKDKGGKARKAEIASNELLVL